MNAGVFLYEFVRGAAKVRKKDASNADDVIIDNNVDPIDLFMTIKIEQMIKPYINPMKCKLVER
jgi:hypothetical protein